MQEGFLKNVATESAKQVGVMVDEVTSLQGGSMGWANLLTKAKALAPKAVAAADKLSRTATGKTASELVKSVNLDDKKTGAEFLVHGGMSVNQVKELLGQSRVFAVDVNEIAQHLDATFIAQVAASAKTQSFAGGTTAIDNDFRRAEIKEAIELLGIGRADNLMKLVVLFDWLTPDHVEDYKSAGLIAPRLGYL